MTMADDPIADARELIAQSITDLKAANIAVPMSLHRAAHALSYAVASRPEDMPACNGQGHAGALLTRKERKRLAIVAAEAAKTTSSAAGYGRG